MERSRCAISYCNVPAPPRSLSPSSKVFPRVIIEPLRLRSLLRLVWQASTVAWIGGGVLLIAAPLTASEPARHLIVITLACVFGFGALGNAWATRGRHFGWMVLSAVVVMAVAGY